MMRRALAALLLILLAVTGVRAQMGVSGGGPSSFAVEATAPTNPINGQLWLRKSDLRQFIYSDSLGKWLGELQMIQFASTATDLGSAGPAGSAMGYLGNACITTSPFQGFDVGADSLRIMEVRTHSADFSATANCTLQVFNDATNILKLHWNANEDSFVPAGSGWVGGGSRAALAPNSTCGVSVVQVTGNNTRPDNPVAVLFVRREVTP